MIFAAGYDSFAYRQPDWASKIEIFEIDHPFTATDKAGERAKKQAAMAELAGQKMLGSYSYSEVEKMLAESGLATSATITAFDNVNYCLAVKQ